MALLGSILADSKETKPEENSIPKVKRNGVTCDSCKANIPTIPIPGVRFKCKTCPNYDLCTSCMRRGAHSQHVLIRIEPSVPKSNLTPVNFCD